MNILLKEKMSSVLLYLLLSLFTFTTFSCDNNDDVPAIEQSVSLDMDSVTLNLGEELVVKPNFTPNLKPQRTYSWVTSNPEVVRITMNDDLSATVTAKRKGSPLFPSLLLRVR